MRAIIYPYKMGSSSAKALAQELETKRVYPDGRYRPRESDLIINWGCSTTPAWQGYNWLNFPHNVYIASDKLQTFLEFSDRGVPTVEWTTDKGLATEWLEKSSVVFARTALRSHSGNGIVVMKNVDELVDAPLYTKYKKKRKEFRAHVFNNNVIDVQQKRKERDVEQNEEESMVRNYRNGWVFCRENLELPSTLEETAIQAVKALGLHFGAADIIWNALEDKCYVLEVNTAPGLTGTTLTCYVNAIKELL